MTIRRLVWTPLIGFGLASGLVQVVAGVILYVSGVYFSPWSALVNLALLAGCVTLGIRRSAGSGAPLPVTFMTCFFAGLTITLCTALVYAVYNLVSVTFMYPDFLDSMARAFPKRDRPTLGLVVANNLRGFVLWGTIVSALAALAFRRPRAGAVTPAAGQPTASS